MTTSDVIHILTEFNSWRRGGDNNIQQPNPIIIGKAIDIAIKELSKTLCSCEHPLVRSGNPEYCGLCEKNLE